MLCIMESVHQFYFGNRWLLQLILQNNKTSYAETRIQKPLSEPQFDETDFISSLLIIFSFSFPCANNTCGQ